MSCARRSDSVCTAETLKASHLSFEYDAFPFVNAHRDRFAGFKLLTWDLNRSSDQRTLQMPSLDPFEAMLIRFPSIFSY